MSIFFFFPFISFAQSLPPIPDVGEGVCVANCGGGNDTALPDEPDTSSTQLNIILNNLKTVPDLEKQAIKKISQKQYTEAETLINNSSDVLNQAKETLNTDPQLEEFRNEKPEVVSKIIRAIDKSLSSLAKASTLIVRINDSGTEESLLSKLIKSAKKVLIDGRRNTIRVTSVMVVAAVRG